MTRQWKRIVGVLALALTPIAGILMPIGHTPPARAGSSTLPPISIPLPNAPLWRYRLPAGNFYATSFIFAAMNMGGSSVGILGYMFTNPRAGTVPLYDCSMGHDYFNSLSPTCEGQTVRGVDGYVYANPVGIPIYRCWNGTYHLTTTNTACDNRPGYGLEGRLGWLTGQAMQS